MTELIELIAKGLVDGPDEVKVVSVAPTTGPNSDDTAVIELRVAKEDLGKIIGKQGRTVRAMRTVLAAASSKLKQRFVLEIIE